MSEDEKRIVTFQYTNYRGEQSVRRAIPLQLRFGTSLWHEGEQWFLFALDVDKGVNRDFALKDCRFTKGEA